MKYKFTFACYSLHSMLNYINFNEDIRKAKAVEISRYQAQKGTNCEENTIYWINTEEINVKALAILRSFKSKKSTKHNFIEVSTWTTQPLVVLCPLFQTVPVINSNNQKDDINLLNYSQLCLNPRYSENKVRSFFEEIFSQHPQTEYKMNYPKNIAFTIIPRSNVRRKNKTN